jgi:purine-binding chemotaxis protein CheW
VSVMREARPVETVWRQRADRLSKRPHSAGQDAFAVLVLGIGKERYGIHLPDVAEVLPPLSPTPVPGTAAVFAGVINVHGEIRPVIDLKRFLGIEAAEHGQTRVILLRQDGRELGLRIDSVQHIRWIEREAAGNGEADASQQISGSSKDLLLLSTEALFAQLGIGVTT